MTDTTAPRSLAKPFVPAAPTTAECIRNEVRALSGGYGEILAHCEKDWASITFAGSRHRLDIAFVGKAAAEWGRRFLAFLPEHEFHIPGQLVADAAVTGVDERLIPEPRLEARVELLLLDEGS